MLSLFMRFLCGCFFVLTSFASFSAIYHRGGRADDFSDKLKVLDNNGKEYCYTASLGSVFDSKLYLYFGSCDDAQSVRYDSYGRLSIRYDDSNYCLTAPSDTVKLKNNWDWLRFDRCALGSRYQQWEFRGDQLFLKDTNFRVQHYYSSSLSRAFYGVICYHSYDCYDNYIDNPSKFNKHYPYPLSMDIPMGLLWESGGGVYYHVSASGASSSEESEDDSISYDPTTRRLISQSYRTSSVSGLIRRVPKRMCLSSPLISTFLDWDWATWEECDDKARSVDDVPKNLRWVPTRINSTGFYSSYGEESAVYLRDEDGNYLSVAPNGYNLGKLYVIGNTRVNEASDWMNPSVFTVSSPIGVEWLDFEARSFLGTFGDSGMYCSSARNVGVHQEERKSFGKYFNLLRDYILRNDDLNGYCDSRVGFDLLCFVREVSALFIVTHPTGVEPFYPVDYPNMFLNFLSEFHRSMRKDIARLSCTDEGKMIFLNMLLDRVLPGRIKALTKGRSISASELIEYIRNQTEGVFLILVEDRVNLNKKRLITLLKESSAEFKGVRILDMNINVGDPGSRDSAGLHNFANAFYGRIDLHSFFNKFHLNSDNIVVFTVVDGADKGNFFYNLRDCDKEKSSASYHQSLEAGAGFTAVGMNLCEVMGSNGGFVKSRCWY